MPDLVAIALPGGPAFVEALQRAWDRGDAVMPVDLRLPDAERARVVAALAPHRLVDAEGEHRLEGGRPVEPGDAVVVATSGSTGTPKGVVLTHDAIVASAQATTARLGVDAARDRWLACLPLAHIGGLSVVLRSLVTGTPVTVVPSPDPALVARAAAEGCTIVSLVATALRRIEPSAFRTIVLGGSRPPEALPANVVTTYGMTETGSGVVYDGVALDGVDVRVAPDGEIHLRGPMLLRAYRDGRDPKDGEGWLATGDLGASAGGRLVVHGRRGDVINTGAEKVWPEPVEAVLGAHPAVADAAVSGRPDPEWGERLVAFVVPRDPSAPPSLEALRAHVKDHLPPWCAPRELVLVATVPRTSLGKVRRDAVRLLPVG